MNVWQRHGPVIFRGSLYFLAALASPFIEKAVPILLGNKWPSPQTWTACWMLGGAAGIIALRAYYDGSAERRGQELKAQKEKDRTRKFNLDTPEVVHSEVTPPQTETPKIP